MIANCVGTVALLLSQPFGCSDSKTDREVTGKVQSLGKPLALGMIQFCPTGGRPIGMLLDLEGKFAGRLPVGEYRVVVQPRIELPAGFKDGDPIPQPLIAVSARYQGVATTDLVATVPEGAETLKLPLFELK